MKESINILVKIDHETIDNIVSTAFEGGITYWCNRAEVIDGDYKGAEFASDAISRGAKILLHECEGDHKGSEEKYTLTKEKVLDGVRIYLEKGISCRGHRKLDLENFDAEDADIIIQYGLFGELVFG